MMHQCILCLRFSDLVGAENIGGYAIMNVDRVDIALAMWDEVDWTNPPALVVQSMAEPVGRMLSGEDVFGV